MYDGKEPKRATVRYMNCTAKFDKDLRCLCDSLPGDDYPTGKFRDESIDAMRQSGWRCGEIRVDYDFCKIMLKAIIISCSCIVDAK